MRNLFLLITLIISSLISYAQVKNGSVSGTAIDGSQKIVASSTITLLKAKDSSVAKLTAADKNGKFEFEKVSAGKYFVSISAVGHQTAYSEIFEITPEGNSISLKPIELVPQSKSLTAVTVVSKKP